MARKDVDLVIRAKDEAAKVVDQITGAITDFVKASKGLETSAGKTDSALGALGKSLGTLDKALKGIAVGDKLAKDLDTATRSLDNLKNEVASTQAEGARLAATLEKTQAEVEQLAAATLKAEAAQKAQAATLAKSREEQQKIAAALGEANGARARAITSVASLTNKIAEQEARVAGATERFNRWKGELEAAEKPTKTLTDRYNGAATSLEKAENKLGGLQTKLAAAQGTIEASAVAIEKFEAGLRGQDEIVAANVRALDAYNQELRETREASKIATVAQTGLEAAIEKNGTVLVRQTGQMERAETAMVEYAAAAGRADSAMADLGARSGQALVSAFASQRREMLETKREWKEQEAVVKTYAQQISAAGVPTAKMAQSFAEARERAAALKTVYGEQKAGLQELSGVMNQQATTVSELAARQGQFIAVQQRVTDSTRKVREETEKSILTNQKLYAVTGSATRTYRPSPAPVRAPKTFDADDAKSVNSVAEAFRKVFGAQRQTLDLMGRLRGEVTSMIAAYAGLYGVIELLNKVVEATTKIQGAQARLNTVTGGNLEATANEYDFVRRNADRLGIDIGELADEYSKFAVAAKGTNLEGANTRKIFISVAEAAKVQRLSFADLQGIFKALTQIVSKGRVQLEELSGQMGDRFPAAVQIMADAITNGSVPALLAMTQKGGVLSDSLIAFADQLDKRFGSQLSSVLKGLDSELGRLQNAATQALVAFGEAGFIEHFTDLVRDLTATLKSAEFQSFAARVSVAFGALADVLGFLAKNFGLVVIAISAFIGIKAVAPITAAIVGQFVTLNRTTDAVAKGMASAATATRAAGTAAATSATGIGIATGAVGGLTAALRLLLTTTGVGLIVTVLTTAAGILLTRTNDVTAAATKHRDIVDQIRNAYDATGGVIDKLREKLASLTVTQLEQNVVNLKNALADTRKEANSFIDTKRGAAYASIGAVATRGGMSRGNPEARKQLADVKALTDEFISGARKAVDYKKALDEIGKSAATSAIKEYIASLIDVGDAAEKQEQQITEAQRALAIKTGTEKEATEAAKALSGANDEVTDKSKQAAQAQQAFNDAMDDLNKLVPDVDDKFKNLKAKEKLDEAFESAKKFAEKIIDLTERQKALNTATEAYNNGLKALDAQMGNKTFSDYGLSSAKSGAEATTAILRREEAGSKGPSLMPYWDKTAWRAGYGSDTITLADGSVKAVAQGIAISVEDANRDLVRRVSQEFLPKVRDQIGAENFDKLTATQQGVLGSTAYNYGQLPERIVDAFKRGANSDEIAKAINGLKTDNGGERSARYERMSALYTSSDSIRDAEKDFDKNSEKAAKDAADKKEKADEYHSTLERDAATNAQINALADDEIIKRAQIKEIAEAEEKARKAGTTLSKEEIETIKKQTAEKYKQADADAKKKTALDAAKAAEKEVTDLVEKRTQLEAQLKIYQEQGNDSKVTETKSAIAEVNTEITKATEAAKLMYKAIGGNEADAAIAKMDTIALKANTVQKKGQAVYWDWSRVSILFADGLTNAFDSFAQQIVAGVKPLTALKNAFLQFAADFLRQIAQMILKATILNALGVSQQGATTGGGLFGLLGMTFGAGHTGGIVGSKRVGLGNQSRTVSPLAFANAQRFHEGGLPGLRPSEVPVIAKVGEEILSETDPRNILNQGGGTRIRTKQSGREDKEKKDSPNDQKDIYQVFVMDQDQLAQALSGSAGRQVVITHLKNNIGEVRRLVGVS